MYSEIETAIRKHALKEYPNECCGLVYLEGNTVLKYKACRNALTTNKTEGFLLDPQDYYETSLMGTVVGLVHSHPDMSAEPSELDLQVCDSNNLDCIIIGFPNGKRGPHEWYKRGAIRKEYPMIGRPFVHGVIDCYTLTRDWYWENRKVILPDIYREDRWWERGLNIYEDHFDENGFVCVLKNPNDEDLKELKVGQILLMNIASNVANHAAIYIGDGKILHHPYGRLSLEEVYGYYYRARTKFVLEYPDGN